MKNILIFKLIIFLTLCLSFVRTIPISSLLKIKSTTNKILESTKKIPKSEESNRTFHHPYPFVHSPPIYFYEDILESSSNIYPSLLVKERPPLPPPPYPAHMIERWQEFYGFTSSPTVSYNRYPQTYPSKNSNPVVTSRPITSKPKPTFISRLTTKYPTVRSTTTTAPQPKITSKPFIVQNNHRKNSTSNNFMQIVVRVTTKSPLTIEAKPVNVLKPNNKPTSKVGVAKPKSPNVVFSRPITVVNPEKHINTTHHQSNIIVAQRPGTNRPTTTVFNTRPSGGGSSNTVPGGSNRPSSPYIALRPMTSALFPFFPPIVAPNGAYSSLVSGMQLMQSFLRNAMLGAVAMFIPSTLFALGLYAATQLNRDDSELPPVPSLSAGRFKRNLCVGVSCEKFDHRSTLYRAYKRENKKKIQKKHKLLNF